jgi:hypothetical protein
MVKWEKPTVETKFHIDFDWWPETGRSFRVDLLSHLCADCQSRYAEYQNAELVDWIDARTAEVTQVDGLWHSLRVCCSQKPDFVSEHTPLATAVFRTFLANGNKPLSSLELRVELGRPADTILRTISGPRVYNGIRPVKQPAERQNRKRNLQAPRT